MRLAALTALPRTVWLLGFISLLNDAASDLVYPLLPLFLAGVLGAGPRVLGLIEGVAEATSALLKLVSGVIVDRTRASKPWVVVGYTLAALSRPVIALATAWPAVLALRFADRVGKGLRSSPRDALLARSVASDQRGVAFGFHRSMDHAGAVVGPLVAAALLAWGVGVRELFLWTAVPGALTVLLALSLKEPDAPAAVETRGFEWSLEGLPSAFRRYLVVVALFTLGNASNTFLLLRASKLGVSDANIPLIWAGVSAVAMLLTTPLSALSDRLGRFRFITIGWVVYAAVYLALGLIGSGGWPLWVLLAVYGVYLAATEGVEKALVADLAPKARLGAAFGWFNMTLGLMLLPASAVFGLLWETIAVEWAFGFAAGCALLATLLLAFWVRPASR
jgi:MFS family permease